MQALSLHSLYAVVVFRLLSIIYRLSSIVYRLSSIVYRLSSNHYPLTSYCLLPTNHYVPNN